MSEKTAGAPHWPIRVYEPADWEAVSRIHDAARMDELRASAGVEAFLPLAECHEEEELFDDTVWVAQDPSTGDVVGFTGAGRGWVSWLYVDPDRYGRGVGTALLRHALAHAGERVQTSVLEGNDRALALYLREGFVITETRSGKMSGNEGFSVRGHELEWRAPAAGRPGS